MNTAPSSGQACPNSSSEALQRTATAPVHDGSRSEPTEMGHATPSTATPEEPPAPEASRPRPSSSSLQAENNAGAGTSGTSRPPSHAAPDRVLNNAGSLLDLAPSTEEAHRIPYSLGRDELKQLQTVLLQCLASVREHVASQLADHGLVLTGRAQQLLLKRAQFLLYYVRVHELLHVEGLKELRLVELVDVIRNEEQLGMLREPCTLLLRHGHWAQRAAAIGIQLGPPEPSSLHAIGLAPAPLL